MTTPFELTDLPAALAWNANRCLPNATKIPWTENELQACWNEWERYLVLVAQDPTLPHAPTLLDGMWRLALWRTEAYTEYCQTRFGRVIPYEVVVGGLTAWTETDRTRLRDAYETAFALSPPHAYWELDRCAECAQLSLPFVPHTPGCGERRLCSTCWDRATDCPACQVPIVRQTELFVKTLTGQSITLYGVDLVHETVADLKRRVEREGGVPVCQQRLIFAGKQLEDDRLLAEYRIQTKYIIHQVLRLGGC